MNMPTLPGAEPNESGQGRAMLRSLRRGQTVSGVVTEIAEFGVTFVDIGGFTAMINITELSWRKFSHPSDIVTVGHRITAAILDVDVACERLQLSIKALHEDPMAQLSRQVGQVVHGLVTKVVPIGAFVRIEDRDDGFEGLVPSSESAGGQMERAGDAFSVGSRITVKIISVDPSLRRIALSHTLALPSGRTTGTGTSRPDSSG